MEVDVKFVYRNLEIHPMFFCDLHFSHEVFEDPMNEQHEVWTGWRQALIHKRVYPASTDAQWAKKGFSDIVLGNLWRRGELAANM